MAQNKLETQIKEQLNSREIKPSETSWDRLDAMLSVAEDKKAKRSFSWLYIAASVLVFLSVGVFLYFQNTKEIGNNNNNLVVGAEDVKDSVNSISNSGVKKIDVNIPNEKVQQLVQTNNDSKSKKQNTIINQKSAVNQNQVTNQNPEVIAQVNQSKPIVEENNSKVRTVNGSTESLLASVEKTQTSSVQKKDSKIKVNPNALLSQVDGELDLTFREKVIKNVNKNYKEIKVAIANRNIVVDKNTLQNQYK